MSPPQTRFAHRSTVHAEAYPVSPTASYGKVSHETADWRIIVAPCANRATDMRRRQRLLAWFGVD
jgi:hypothetical protein